MNKYVTPDDLSRAMMGRGRDYVRELVRQREKRSCQCCGKKWETGMRRFDVHYLNGDCGKRSHGHDRVADIPNLITYCHKCHINLEEVRHKLRTKNRQLQELSTGQPPSVLSLKLGPIGLPRPITLPQHIQA